MIKAIIFDLGGVIYKTNWKGLNDDFRKKHGFDIRLLSDKKVYEMFAQAKTGKSSVEEIAKYLGHNETKEIIKDYKESYYKNKILNHEIMKIIAKLEGRYGLYVITDTNKEHYEADLEGGLLRRFKKAYASHILGRLKDDKSVFEEVIREIGVKSQEVLFIDDNERNIKNAKELGIETIHYLEFPQTEELIKEMKKHGLEI